MEENIFRFKKFNVSHGKGSMKVGVDAVLLGAWAGKEATKILDVGTGSGVISLILAQRFPNAKILAIDIDPPSIEEASQNFQTSPWRSRLNAAQMEFPMGLKINPQKFDLIVSNPPFFKAGIEQPITQREKARHQSSLSIFSLLKYSTDFLENHGRISIISPIEYLEEALNVGKENNLEILRLCRIRDNYKRPEKRMMLEFGFCKKNGDAFSMELLTLFDEGNSRHEPTVEYRNLCKDFYLKF